MNLTFSPITQCIKDIWEILLMVKRVEFGHILFILNSSKLKIIGSIFNLFAGWEKIIEKLEDEQPFLKIFRDYSLTFNLFPWLSRFSLFWSKIDIFPGFQVFQICGKPVSGLLFMRFSWNVLRKCLHSELFWSVFFSHWDWIRREWMRENTDQNNCEYGNFLRNDHLSRFMRIFPKMLSSHLYYLKHHMT